MGSQVRVLGGVGYVFSPFFGLVLVLDEKNMIA